MNFNYISRENLISLIYAETKTSFQYAIVLINRTLQYLQSGDL